MKISIFFSIFLSTLVFACPDLSGTYVDDSTASPLRMLIAQRIIKIVQNNCKFRIDGDDGYGGLSDFPDILRADGLAYDRSPENLTTDGHVVVPFLPARANSVRVIRSRFINDSLVVGELSPWFGGTYTEDCKEEVELQDRCSYHQRIFALNGNALTETQNGYIYSSSGANIPTVTHYQRQLSLK